VSRKPVTGGRRYHAKENPLEGRPTIDDLPIARGKAFAAALGRGDLRRIAQLAAVALQERRAASGGAISRDAAVRRVKEAVEQFNPPGTPDASQWIKDVLHLDMAVEALRVRESDDPWAAASNLLTAILANFALARDPALRADVRQDPAAAQALVDRAREWASVWMAADIVSIDG
jgi:hypothetical protein